MRRRDLSLVFFTLASQCSIGLVLWLTVLALLPDQSSIPAETGLSLANPVLFALLLVAVATAVSFLHLGNPVNAPRAIRNLATSWLSREILAIGLYKLTLFIAFVAAWQAHATGFAWTLLAPAALAGLFLLWTMSGVYLVVTVPPWNSAHTPLGFTLTTGCLGAATCLLLGTTGNIAIDPSLLEVCGAALAIILVLEIVAGYANQRRLERMDTGFRGPDFERGALRVMFLGRMTLLVAGLGLALYLLGTENGFCQEHAVWLYFLLSLVALQELAGRLLFYGSYFRVGL
jgi:anaerobic dimethyl sulfoxide reductase subunit C (anchor subunit)